MIKLIPDDGQWHELGPCKEIRAPLTCEVDIRSDGIGIVRVFDHIREPVEVEYATITQND